MRSGKKGISDEIIRQNEMQADHHRSRARNSISHYASPSVGPKTEKSNMGLTKKPIDIQTDRHGD